VICSRAYRLYLAKAEREYELLALDAEARYLRFRARYAALESEISLRPGQDPPGGVGVSSAYAGGSGVRPQAGDSMNRNVEVKARVKDRERLEQILYGRAAPTLLSQRDTFFRCPEGRLKLREEATSAELIFYARETRSAARESRYWRSPVADAAGMKALLAAAFGIVGVVDKQRLLFLLGQTRVHLDAVRGLGTFVELEVVLSEHQTIELGQQIAAALMRELEIEQDDLLGQAYVDLLPSGSPAAPRA
jgi:predicted adenylyl cyclase CyaB